MSLLLTPDIVLASIELYNYKAVIINVELNLIDLKAKIYEVQTGTGIGG